MGRVSKQLINLDAFDREIAVADSVPALKSLADKGAAIIDYMRKAGKFDDATVNEITYRVGDAVRKAGGLLEDIAPEHGGSRKQVAPSRHLNDYAGVLETAGLKDRTARDWRAASKLGTEAYGKYLVKLRKHGERLKLRDLYRLGRPAQKRAAVGKAAKLIGQYPILYADPPWQYEHPPMGSTARSIEAKYPTMTLAEIKKIKLPAHDDCVLFLWATAPKLPECLEVMEAWGFTYRTCMVWFKDKMGTGYYVRNQHELLLIGRRGDLPVPEPGTQPISVIEAPRTKHSAKPPEFYEAIEQMYPQFKGQWYEIFLRGTARENWAGGWGNEADAT